MRKTKLLILLCTLSLICPSCKKEEVEIIGPTGVNSSNQNNGNTPDQNQKGYINFDSDVYIIYVGGNKQINITHNVDANKIKWVSSNNEIARVDKGKIEGLKVGECEVSAYLDSNDDNTLNKNSEIYKSVKVIVKQQPSISSTNKVTYFPNRYNYSPESDEPLKYLNNDQFDVYYINTEGSVPYIKFDNTVNTLAAGDLYSGDEQSDNLIKRMFQASKDNSRSSLYRFDVYPNNDEDLTMYAKNIDVGIDKFESIPLYFDFNSNQLRCSDYTYFCSYLSRFNNGIPGDQCSLVKFSFMEESSNTKYIRKPQPVTFDLNKYNINMYEINGEAYVPLQLFLNVICNINYNSIYYYFDGDVLSSDLAEITEKGKYSSYIYSGENGFAFFDLTNNNPSYTTFVKKEENVYTSSIKYTGEIGKEINASKNGNTFYSNAIATFNTTTKKVNISFGYVDNEDDFTFSNNELVSSNEYYFEQSGDTIKIIDAITYTNYETNEEVKDDIFIRTTGKGFAKNTFGENEKAFNYNLLNFKLDYFYGLKKDLKVTSFDEYFKKTKAEIKINSGIYKSKDTIYNLFMNSETIEEFDYVENYIFSYLLGDGHTRYTHSSPQGRLNSIRDSLITSFNASERENKLFEYYYKYATQREEVNNSDETEYIVEGSTAILQFDMFDGDTSYTQGDIKTCIDEFKLVQTTDETGDNYISSENDYYNELLDTKGIYFAALYAITDLELNHKDVTNIVFDITVNGGGAVLSVPQLVSLMTNDPSIIIEDTLTDALIDYHYKLDINNDDIFGGEDDTYEGKFNFYILQSEYSFSCGSMLPAVCKTLGCAKIIGSEYSGGGACSVSQIADHIGNKIRISSRDCTMLSYDNGKTYVNNDLGVKADKVLSSDYWYNYSYLDSWINSNF